VLTKAIAPRKYSRKEEYKKNQPLHIRRTSVYKKEEKMKSKSWCNIKKQMDMNSSKFLILTLIISIVWTSGALANDQRSKQSSLSDSTAEKVQQNKLHNNNRPIFIDENDDEFEGSGRKGEVHEDLRVEDDDNDGSGSGFGDDEDDVRRGPHIIKPDQTLNTHHSVTGGTDSRPKEQFPNRGTDPFDNGPTHHVPVSPTDPSSGNSDNVLIMNTSHEDRTTSFFAQPGILAAVIGGAVVGLLFAILVVMFIVYRMRKKDEGSYALDEPQKRSPQANSYTKNHNNREFYA